MERILITGSSGFIGSHLKRALPNAVGLDVCPSRTTDVVADICNFKTNIHWDVVYHLAAIANVEDCVRNPLASLKTNVCGTLNILQLDFDLLIFSSSVGVNQPFKSPYHYAKAITEHIIKLSEKPYIIFRFANVYGKGSRGVIQKFINDPVIRIYGDGKQVRDFIYIDDLIDHLAKCETLRKNRLYYIGSGIPTSINRVAEILAQNQNKEVVHMDPREFDIKRPVIKADLKCKTSIEEGIKKCLEKNS